MTSKFSIDNRELLQRISSGEAVVGIDFGNLIVRELAAFRLAAMDSEPVAWRYRTTDINGNPNPRWSFSEEASLMGLYQPLYTTPLPAPVSDCKPVAWLAIYHGEIYDEAIGITRSVDEAQADRFGWESALTEIIPLYRHAQQPVVPENRVTAEHRRVIEMLLNVCGAAFELADDSCQQDVDGEDCHVVPDGAFQKLSDALDEIENTLPTEDIDRPDVFLAWSAMPRAALKSILNAGNSPVIPEGYVMVPMRLTAENGAKGVLSGEFSETQFVNCPECFGDDECETCDGSGRIEIKVPVSWTTIKEIWIKGVEHFAAAPQENN